MDMRVDGKALSTLTAILLMLIAAIVGGVIAYAFTIAAYVDYPHRTTLVITDFYLDKQNVTYFRVNVLNPSYSPASATISSIAVSVKGENQLYYVTETEPAIAKNGLVVSSGESLKITCSKVNKDGENITFGEFVSQFPGKTIITHVFSPDSAASNVEAGLPFVKLDITADFNPQVSFKKFNVTLKNEANSEVDLTVTGIIILGVGFEEMTPNLGLQPETIPKNGSLDVMFKGNWHGFNRTVVTVFTKQGYMFKKEVELKTVNAAIQNVTFNEAYPDRFNVTIFNSAESAANVTVNKVVCTLPDGTSQTFQDFSVDIMPGSAETIKLNWNWSEYKGETITVVAYFAQDFETDPFTATIPST
ncbi:MAG: hypothetical protein RMJ15_04970 [Nitrososphaerota archaeon]|nr:hypothetical protein [Candidatus Bathyarchaeota archaeon]MDW8023071.1 hypothetical protein [Nitrososphaerota archaeon]